jgi:hypothetical protein
MTYLQLSKQWRLEQRGVELYVFGGQDAIFTIDLEKNNKSFFATLKHGQKFTADTLTLNDRTALEQLISAEVVTPLLGKRVKSGVRIKFKIVSKKSVASAFMLDGASFKQIDSNDYDFLLMIRTNETLKEFLEENNYLELTKPHLFLDLAYNHTISLGPLVFPGVTSCIACLEGRIGMRWGDEKPPSSPQSSNELIGLAKEWLAVELGKLFKDEDYTLIDRTVVLDMQNRTINSNKLLTVPLCNYCQKRELLTTGKLEYNFAKA